MNDTTSPDIRTINQPDRKSVAEIDRLRNGDQLDLAEMMLVDNPDQARLGLSMIFGKYEAHFPEALIQAATEEMGQNVKDPVNRMKDRIRSMNKNGDNDPTMLNILLKTLRNTVSLINDRTE